MTFLVADAVISTNESYRRVAIERGKMRARSGVDRQKRAGLVAIRATRARPEPAER